MRMTCRKKKILSYYQPEHREQITNLIGLPPFDVYSVALLLRDGDTAKDRHHIESTRRTLDNMVRYGVLERVSVREWRNGRYGPLESTVIRYGLPGDSTALRDADSVDCAINESGKCG